MDKNNDFKNLLKIYPIDKYTVEDTEKLFNWGREYKKENRTNYGLYILIILILIIIIVGALHIYQNIKPDTKLIDEMNMDKNKSTGIEIYESN